MKSAPLHYALQALLWTVLAVPAAVFLWAVVEYSVNIPFYDDITQVLWIVNTFIEGQTDAGTPPHVFAVDGRLHAIFYPNAGHVPMVTRLFALAQYALGGVNFYYATIIACAFWVVAVAGLIRYWQRGGLPLYALLPLPFLFFSLSQWEAMPLMLGGIQVYIGTLFLPLLVLWLLTEQRIVLAAVAFFFALFACAGSLSLLPLGVAYLLWHRRWRALVVFVLMTLPSVWLFVRLNVFAVSPLTIKIDLQAMLDFFTLFMGNIAGNGSANLGPLHDIHYNTGIAVLLCSALGLLVTRGQDLARLILVYAVMLAAMTALQRGSEGGYIVPRYSIFALLGVGATYVLLAAWLQRVQQRAFPAFVVIATLTAAWVWVDSVQKGIEPLAFYKEDRAKNMRDFVRTGDASMLMWNPEWCVNILNKSRALGVYDFSAEKNLHP